MTRRQINALSLAQAAGYVLSGCSQPLLVQLCKNAGLADPKAQLYMWFYYLGPSVVLLPALWEWKKNQVEFPLKGVYKAIGIACFDTFAASLNYTGASLAGPTIFSIVYSSVTIWTAVFSQLILDRRMNYWQWASVCLVFGGLALTATDSLQLGQAVVQGLFLVMLGSVMHAMTYILCEAVMTVGEETLTVTQNCGIQATVACFVMGIWQLVYTIPHWEQRIGGPMRDAETTPGQAVALLLLFGFANWIHSITFYETLVRFPGGGTSAGVMKGLQAVLVFVATHVAFCGRTGGDELCFTRTKFISLVTVVGGVLGYGIATQHKEKNGSNRSNEYEMITTAGDIEIEPV